MPKTIFPAVIELSSLNGKNGFKINGETSSDYSGYSVSNAGDINDDGINDLIIGAYLADPGSRYEAGSSYVIFGKSAAWATPFELSTLNGNNGFKINGEAADDYSGCSVKSVGDINGDGIADVIVGAYRADPPGKGGAGSSYVVFGKNGGWTTSFELSTLNGNNGFKINGEAADDYSGISVSAAGDINADGIDDLIIGASRANPGGRIDAGSSYVIFGSRNPWINPFELSSLNGTNGFRINGVSNYDYSGCRVSRAGDVNGDGFDDLIIGVCETNSFTGFAYVIFGKDGAWTTPFELSALNGVNGFKINGEAAGDQCGGTVSGGDINGDGYSDIIIGASTADPTIPRSSAGSSYVIFGKSGGWTTPFDLSTLNGINGFTINGELNKDFSGCSISVAGDINHDGYKDILIGAYGTDANGKEDSGASYILFGKSGGWTTPFELSTLNGNNGFKINGEAIDDYSGESVSYIGDFNHDGVDDIIIGAYAAEPHEKWRAGSSYVIFGDFSSELTANQLSIKEGEVKVLNLFNLNATKANFTGDFLFVVSNLQYGYFSYVFANETMIESFWRQEVDDYQVQFVHDGSKFAPAYGITVHTDKFAISETQMATITFTTINSIPELNLTDVSLNYTENGMPIVIAPDIAVFDVDHTNLSNATVTITNNFYVDQDILTFVDQLGLMGIYYDESGILMLNGNSSIEDYQIALRNITYENLLDNPAVATRTISFMVYDGIDNSLPVTRDIHVIPMDDCPTLTGSGGTLSYAENDPATIIDEGIAITDLDHTQLTGGTVAITAHFSLAQDVLLFTNQNGISGYYNNQTGILTLTGVATVADYQTAICTVSYKNLSEDPETDAKIISFSVSDGECNSNIVTRNIQIIAENDRPILVNNRLTITEGQNVTLTPDELSATDVDCDEEGLIFTVNTVQHGQFKSVYAVEELTSFTQRNITQGDIYFLHDGASSAPSYFVRVSDGELTNIEGFQPASITFIPGNDPPLLIYNQLTIYRGQEKYLTSTDLNAVDEETSDADLIFNISDIQHGYFEDTLTTIQVTNFIQSKITQTEIRFIHDGSIEAPSYAVSVSDGVNTLPPAQAVITFIPQEKSQLIDNGGIFDNPLYRALLIAGISGGAGLLFLILRICLYRKATKSLERLTDMSHRGTTMQQQANFQKNVLRPIAKAIFDRIKITGCLGYIGDNRMQDYLDAVMRIIVELKQQNVNVELETLTPAGQTLLVNEIARQTERLLMPKQSCCGSCMRYFNHLCAADVNPEDIEQSARGIALAVKTSLQQNNFDAFLSNQMAVNLTRVDMDLPAEATEEPIEMAVLGNVIKKPSDKRMEMPLIASGLYAVSGGQQKPSSNDLFQQGVIQNRMMPR